MTQTATPTAPSDAHAPDGVAVRAGTGRIRRDLPAVGAYALVAGLVYWGLLHGGYLTDSASDQTLFEWFYRAVAWSVRHGHNPFVLGLENAPDGVNTMANTAQLGLSVPLAPVTIWLGARVTFAVVMIGGAIATATGWYRLFSRYAVRSRLAAGIAGGFCAFAPGMVSQGTAHAQLVAVFPIPFIIAGVAGLPAARRPGRRGIAVGLLVAYQALLGEEALLLAALGGVVFLAAWLPAHRHAVREYWHPVAVGAASAVGVAVAALAYPLWMQFFGPQHYRGIPLTQIHHNDVASFITFDTFSFLSRLKPSGSYGSITEQNTGFGLGLLLLCALIVWWLRREAAVRAAAIGVVIFSALSLGSPIYLNGQPTVRGPWALLDGVPLLDSVVPSRLALVAVPFLALLLARATDRVVEPAPSTAAPSTAAPSTAAKQNAARKNAATVATVAWLAALAAALLPIVPVPLPTAPDAPGPALFAGNAWQRFISPGDTVVSVPSSDGMLWQLATGMGFRITGGYFVGPAADGTGSYYGAPRPTALMLDSIAAGYSHVIDSRDRDNARADVAYWHADVIAMSLVTDHAGLLAAALDDLFGPGQSIGGMRIWPATVTGA